MGRKVTAGGGWYPVLLETQGDGKEHREGKEAGILILQLPSVTGSAASTCPHSLGYEL